MSTIASLASDQVAVAQHLVDGAGAPRCGVPAAAGLCEPDGLAFTGHGAFGGEAVLVPHQARRAQAPRLLPGLDCRALPRLRP